MALKENDKSALWGLLVALIEMILNIGKSHVNKRGNDNDTAQ